MLGAGTQADPYIISTPADLDAVRNNMTAYYELANDIDMSGFGNFNPIAKITTSTDRFNGSFDGKGYKIKNLTINDNANYTGLFGITNTNSLIKNVGLENCSIQSTASHIGALVGRDYGQINNCYSTGTVSGSNYVGGVAGYSYGSTIEDCFSECDVSGNNFLGGFIGHTGPSYSNSILKNCYSIGNVGTATNSGGFTGYYDNTTLENCYFNTETSGHTTDPIATGLTTAQMKSQSSYTNWDFTNTWGIDSDYPYLQVFGSPSPAGVVEERQVLSYVNNIYTSTQANISVLRSVKFDTKPIFADIDSQKSKSINTNSYIIPIVSDVTTQNRTNKIINVQSFINPINSDISTQATSSKVIKSYILPINSKVITPNIILPIATANCWYEENLTNITALENKSNIYSVENPSYCEVI